jgi:hypothetical protein
VWSSGPPLGGAEDERILLSPRDQIARCAGLIVYPLAQSCSRRGRIGRWGCRRVERLAASAGRRRGNPAIDSPPGESPRAGCPQDPHRGRGRR